MSIKSSTFYTYSIPDGQDLYHDLDSVPHSMITAPMNQEKSGNILRRSHHSILPKTNIVAMLGKEQITQGTYAEAFTESSDTVVITLQDGESGDFEGNSLLNKTRDGEYYKTYALLKEANNNFNNDELRKLAFFIRNHISSENGTTPSILIVDKTGRYGHLPMILPGESLQFGVGSDLSKKSYLEWYMGLESVFKVLKEKFPKNYSNIIGTMQLSSLGGGTLPWLHMHLIEVFSQVNNEELEKMGINPEVLERVKHKEINQERLSEFYDEMIFDNFLKLSASLEKLNNQNNSSDYTNFYNKIKTLETELLSHNNGKDNQNTLGENLNRKGFLRQLSQKEANGYSLIDQFEAFKGHFKEDSYKMKIEKRREHFLSLVNKVDKNINVHKDIDKVKLSKAQHIYSAGLIKKLQNKLDKNLPALLEEANVSSSEKITVEVTDFFDSKGNTPRVKIKSSFAKMGIAGQKIEAFIDKALNQYWTKIDNLGQEVIKLEKDIKKLQGEDNSQDKIQNLEKVLIATKSQLKEELGYDYVLEDMSQKDVAFSRKPSSITSNGRGRKTKDINKASDNYLNFFLDCFKHGGKNPVMQHDKLMPRVMCTVPSKDGDSFELSISPSISYLPIISLRLFEKIFGSFKLFEEKNARLEIVGEGEKQTIVQKMGGEGFHTFQSDDILYNLILIRQKEESLYKPLAEGEEQAVDIFKREILKNVANPENVKNKQRRFLEYYLEEALPNEIKGINLKFLEVFLEKLDFEILNSTDTEKINKHFTNALNDCKISGKLILQISKIAFFANKSRISNQNDDKNRFLSAETVANIAKKTRLKTSKILDKSMTNIPLNEWDIDRITHIFSDREFAREQNDEYIERDNTITLSTYALSKKMVQEYYGGTILELEKYIKTTYSETEVRTQLGYLEYEKAYLASEFARLIYKYITRDGYQDENINEFKNFLKNGNIQYINTLRSKIHTGLQEAGFQDADVMKGKLEAEKKLLSHSQILI